MSVRIMAQVWDAGPEDQGELLILLALADFANDDGECWPSMETIARKARIQERSARRIVRRLEAGGWLSIDTGTGRHGCNKYVVKVGPKVPRTESPPDRKSPESRTLSAESRTRGSPEPSRTIKEPSGRVRAILCQVLSEETADAFMAHRKAKRSKITEHAAELIVAKLKGCQSPAAAIELSIMNGWTGVFPERVQGAKPASSKADKWNRIARAS